VFEERDERRLAAGALGERLLGEPSRKPFLAENRAEDAVRVPSRSACHAQTFPDVASGGHRIYSWAVHPERPLHGPSQNQSASTCSDRATRRLKRRPASIDTAVIYCGDNLDHLRKMPDGCVDLVYIDPPFNSNRNYEVFWGETKEKRAFEDRHESTRAYIDFMRPRCVELARVLKPTGSFYYHCDWHASHYVKANRSRVQATR